MKWVLLLVVLLAQTSWALADTNQPLAPPYELVAVYEVGDKTREVRVRDQTILLDEGSEPRIKRILLRLRRASFAGAAVGVYANFAATVNVDGRKLRDVKIEADAIGDVTDMTLLDWDSSLLKGQRQASIVIKVHANLHDDFLCAMEHLYRTEEGGKITANVLDQLLCAARKQESSPESSPVACTPGIKTFMLTRTAKPSVPAAPSGVYKRWWERPLSPITVDDTEIVYSFCGKSIDWKHDDVPNPWAVPDEQVEAKHREALATTLINSKILKRFTTLHTAVEFASAEGETKKDLMVRDQISFSILDAGQLFEVTEENRTVGPGEVTLMDSGSRVAIRVDPKAAVGCPSLKDVKLAFRLRKKDGAPVGVGGNFREKCKVVLNAKLADYLDHEVTLTVAYALPEPPSGTTGDKLELIVWETSFEVRNLGWVWSAPVVSEIVTAAKKRSKDDLKALSSMPLSVAIGGGKERAAITFPFKLGYNPASAPQLERVISGFAHLSVLFDPADDETLDNTVFAAGAGVDLFETFYFSWGVELGSPHSHLFLVGVSIPDIADLGKLGDPR